MVYFIMVYDNNGLSKHCTSWFSCPIVVYEENIVILEYCFIIFNLSWQETDYEIDGIGYEIHYNEPNCPCKVLSAIQD